MPPAEHERRTASVICDLIANGVTRFKDDRGMVLILQEGLRIRLFFFNGVPKCSWNYTNGALHLDRVGESVLERPPTELALAEEDLAALATTVRSRFRHCESVVSPLWRLDPAAWD